MACRRSAVSEPTPVLAEEPQAVQASTEVGPEESLLVEVEQFRGQPELTLRAEEAITMIAEDPTSWGEVIARLAAVPEDGLELLRIVSTALGERDGSGELCVARYGGHFLLSPATEAGQPSDFTGGYIVDIRTGKVRTFSLW